MADYKKYLLNLKEKCSGKVITLLPHDRADVDSIVSCVLMQHLLKHFNIDSKIKIYDNFVDIDTKELLKKLYINVEDYYAIEDFFEEKYLILLDHYHTNHFGRIEAIIDHHPTEKIMDWDYYLYLYSPSISTAYIIYQLMQAANIQLTPWLAKLVVYASLVDTVSFKNTKTNEREKYEIVNLARIFHLDFEKMCKESLMLTPIDAMPIEEICMNGQKSYNFNGKCVYSSYVQIEGKIDKHIDDIYKFIVKKENEIGLAMWVFIVFDLKDNCTDIYYISPTGGLKVQKSKKILSRGKDIMPHVEEKLINI